MRGQADAFACGLSQKMQNNRYSLIEKLEKRFGTTRMKECYIADAKLRRKRKGETYREIGQAVEDLYRKAYPDNVCTRTVTNPFLDSCHDSSDFRMSVKRTHPSNLHQAITCAMQEGCFKKTEQRRPKGEQHGVYDI